MFFRRFQFSRDIGIDLGTANTLMYVSGKGIVLQEPSVVAIDLERNVPLAVGDEAKLMLGRTPGNIRAVRPLRDGVIADFDAAEQMIKTFIQKGNEGRVTRSQRLVIGIPAASPVWNGGPCGRPVWPVPVRFTSSTSPWPPPSVPACR